MNRVEAAPASSEHSAYVLALLLFTGTREGIVVADFGVYSERDPTRVSSSTFWALVHEERSHDYDSARRKALDWLAKHGVFTAHRQEDRRR